MKTLFSVISLFVIMFVFSLAGMVSVTFGSKGQDNKKPAQILRVDEYNCGSDPCQGYSCVGDVNITEGVSVSPACYNSSELSKENCKNGTYEYIPSFSAVCDQTDYYYVWVK